MRLALLTGGSRGLGAAVVRAAVREGFEVIEFSRGAPHAHSVRVDLSAPLEAHRAIATRLGGIEMDQVRELIVISNAGTLEPIGPVARKPAEAIVDSLHTNLTSAILFCAAAVGRFQSVPARKVLAHISAGGVRDGVFGWSLYAAAKVAMETFIRSVALEQSQESHPFIPVNVDPGVVDTEMHVVAGAAAPADFPSSSRFAERKSQGGLAPPDEAATALIRLLARASLQPGGSYDLRDGGSAS